MKPYPFVPIQLTLISALTIGIPSFFFALESNNNKIKNIFSKNILTNEKISNIMKTTKRKRDKTLKKR